MTQTNLTGLKPQSDNAKDPFMERAREIREEKAREAAIELAADERRAKLKKEFEENYKYGSTTVINFKNEWFFIGDISHSGKKNIFHNAVKIKEELIKRNFKYSHMNYNDLPDFKSLSDYTHFRLDKKHSALEVMREEAKNYKHTIFKIRNAGIVIFENWTLDKEPEKQIYCLDEEDDDFQEDEIDKMLEPEKLEAAKKQKTLGDENDI